MNGSVSAIALSLAVLLGLGWMRFKARRRQGEIFPIPFLSRWIRLGVLQQYVLSETVSPILLSVLALTFFLLVRQIYELIDLLLANGAIGLVLQLVLTQLPFIFSLTVPVAVLLGTILGIGRLAVENEIRACQTAGVHLVRIFYPMILLSASLSLSMIAINYEYAPMLQKQFRRIFNRATFEAFSAIPPGVNKDFKDKNTAYNLFYARRDPATGEMRSIRMLMEMKKKPSATAGKPSSAPVASEPAPAPRQIQRNVVIAASGKVTYDETSDMVLISLQKGSVNSSEAGNSSNSVARQDPRKASLSEIIIPFDSIVYQYQPEKMEKTTAEFLAQEMIQALAQGKQYSRWKGSDKRYNEEKQAFKLELARRTAVPLACVAFVLLGIPLAIFARPSGKSIGVAIALLLVMIYYWMVQWGSGMVEDGHDVGLFIIFLPNILMSGLGLVLFRRAVRL